MKKQQLILFSVVNAPIQYMLTHGFNSNIHFNSNVSFRTFSCSYLRHSLPLTRTSTCTPLKTLYWSSSSKGPTLHMTSLEQGEGGGEGLLGENSKNIDKSSNAEQNNRSDTDINSDGDNIKGVNTDQSAVSATDSPVGQSEQQKQKKQQQSKQTQQSNFQSQSPYLQTDQEEVIGIGGKGGYTYDVNKLKSNLVQKSIKQFKTELLQLLVAPSTSESPSPSKILRNQSERRKSMYDAKNHDLIDEKISALISTNPVSTTTDSNLLDGSWGFAYSTKNAEDILQDSRVVLSKPRRKLSSSREEFTEAQSTEGSNTSSTWRLRPHGEKEDAKNLFTSWSREFNLENLNDDEDPFMVDRTTRFGSLITTERYFKIVGLSRTSLEVEPISRTHYILGKGFNTKINNNIRKQVGDQTILMELQFIYLDSDLCITMSKSGASSSGDSGILNVYTKNKEWRESRINKTRLVMDLLSRLSTFESPMRLRRKISSIFKKKGSSDDGLDGNKLTEEEYQILLRRVSADKESKLMALRLGDLWDNSEEDEEAWEGDEDPFVHLSADERQQIMKQMSIEEITEAGTNHKRLMMKLEKKKGFKRQKKFKRPSFGWEGDRKNL